MKTKQSACVLIKILGLSVFVASIPGIITGLFNARLARGAGSPGDWWFFPVPSLVLAAIGIYLIAQSRQVTALLFKSDDE
jgi:hypothetical protein